MSAALAQSDKAFTGSIPELYERHLVPLIFEPYARDLAERIAAKDPMHVLEIAAGTGVVTRALASRLPTTRIVATDLNAPMLEHAKTRIGQRESNGKRLMPKTCRLMMKASTRLFASSGPCSSRTRNGRSQKLTVF